VRAPLVALVILGLSLASPAVAAPGWKRGSPQSALVLAERVLLHDASWSPTSIYCLPPKRSPYKGTDGATQKTFRCQWVKQNYSRPWEIDTVQMVYGKNAGYLFSLVSSEYPQHARPALCRVSPTVQGFRTRCHPR
jgi:hypothetical protein